MDLTGCSQCQVCLPCSCIRFELSNSSGLTATPVYAPHLSTATTLLYGQDNSGLSNMRLWRADSKEAVTEYHVASANSVCMDGLHCLRAGHCSPRHSVRVPVPLLPRPVSHARRPPQPTPPLHCCTAQQPQRSRHVSGAVSARACQGRGSVASPAQQTGLIEAKVTQCKGRAVAKKGTTGTRALTLRKGHNENLQSR